MLKNTFFTACLFTASALSAQITISSTDMPNAGDSILVSVTGITGIADPLPAGANFNWDYSALIRSSQHYEKFDSPFSFTSPFNLLFNIFNTTYGKENTTFANIPGVPITSAYDFFKKSSSSLKQIGSGYTVNNAPLPFIYTSPDVIYKFPLNYLNTDFCDFKFGLPIPTFGYYGQTGHRENTVDGWGTLITPFGTFQTVRVRSAITTIDTIYSTAVSFGTNINRPTKYEFKWLAAGKKIPVLEIDANDIAGNLTVTNVQYIDSLPAHINTGVNENVFNNSNLIVFPNPCVDEIALFYNLPAGTNVKITLVDILGKKAADLINENQNEGIHQKAFSIGDLQLSPGIYFLNFQTKEYKQVQKIVVSR